MIPSSEALLEGSTTTPEKLAEKGETSQFWKVLSGCLSATPSNGGRRVDLLGCRVVEAPREGASLLRDLWVLTAVPFAAADDALGGYRCGRAGDAWHALRERCSELLTGASVRLDCLTQSYLRTFPPGWPPFWRTLPPRQFPLSPLRSRVLTCTSTWTRWQGSSRPLTPPPCPWGHRL